MIFLLGNESKIGMLHSKNLRILGYTNFCPKCSRSFDGYSKKEMKLKHRLHSKYCHVILTNDGNNRHYPRVTLSELTKFIRDMMYKHHK